MDAEFARQDAGDIRPIIVRLFGRLPSRLLQVDDVTPLEVAALPPTRVALLAHDRHMTVVLEAHCGGKVAVRVLDRVHDGDRYARETLLGVPGAPLAQYALVAVTLTRCPPAIRAGILAGDVPLGRVLLPIVTELRVEVAGYVQVVLPPALAAHFACPASARAYGRLVRIRRHRNVLIEGMEVLSPALA